MKGELEVARNGLNRQFNRDLAAHKKQAADQLQEDVRRAEAAREAEHKAKLAQLVSGDTVARKRRPVLIQIPGPRTRARQSEDSGGESEKRGKYPSHSFRRILK